MMLHHFEEDGSLTNPSKCVVLLVHGLSGSGTDAYAIELVRSLRAAGMRVVSSTRRGHGDLLYTSKHISHAAAEADVAILVDALVASMGTADSAPIVLLGVSFGGLLTLRYVSDPSLLSARVAGALTVCAIARPMMNSAYVARQSGALGRFVDRAVGTMLRSQLTRSGYVQFAALDAPRGDVRSFDERFVCPAAGFASTDAYYAAADAAPALRERAKSARVIPVRMINALDDPVVDPASLTALTGVDIELTDRGGHCGDPRGLRSQLVCALRGGVGANYHAQACACFVEEISKRGDTHSASPVKAS